MQLCGMAAQPSTSFNIKRIDRSIPSMILKQNFTETQFNDCTKHINFCFSGAVANGRAKFETTNTQKNVSPEKPSRFFGSRSRTNSPMLPVKTPKVPASALKDLKNGNGNSDKKDSKDQDLNSSKDTLDPPSLSSSGKTSSANSNSNHAQQAKSPVAVNLGSNKLLSKLRKK